MCCVAGSAGRKDLLCLCLFRGVLDDVHAPTGGGFIAVGKHYQLCFGQFCTTVELIHSATNILVAH